MKTLILSLLIITALLLVGSTSIAQPRESDRDWIDSLAVQYRVEFIRGDMLRNEATLDSLSKNINMLILDLRKAKTRDADPGDSDGLITAIREYDHQREVLQLRSRAYTEEMRLVRTNFSVVKRHRY